MLDYRAKILKEGNFLYSHIADISERTEKILNELYHNEQLKQWAFRDADRIRAYLQHCNELGFFFGETEVSTLELNGWNSVGTILIGPREYDERLEDKIKITAIGEEKFICRWKYAEQDSWCEESGNTTLRLRSWRLDNEG